MSKSMHPTGQIQNGQTTGTERPNTRSAITGPRRLPATHRPWCARQHDLDDEGCDGRILNVPLSLEQAVALFDGSTMPAQYEAAFMQDNGDYMGGQPYLILNLVAQEKGQTEGRMTVAEVQALALGLLQLCNAVDPPADDPDLAGTSSIYQSERAKQAMAGQGVGPAS